ncbi:unnamed protein product [Thelazia callipaeda]|uniref:Tudor domain-containing protein n=1 Tax=Thelazia callipaeda TaxID=103827 RepID=A0A0N5CNG1_THECL|nr:unnamed protein product [Thelazia callipaeda]
MSKSNDFPSLTKEDIEAIFDSAEEMEETIDLNPSSETIGSNNESVACIGCSRISPAVKPTQVVSPMKQMQSSLSSCNDIIVCVMDLLMKREQTLRIAGNTTEANALNAVGFAVINLIAKAVELLESNESVHLGSLLLDALKVSMHKKNNEWENLVLCMESIINLIDQVRKISEVSKCREQEKRSTQPTSAITDKNEYIVEIVNRRKKRKLDGVSSRKHKVESGQRRQETNETYSNLISYSSISPQKFSKVSHQASTPQQSKNHVKIFSENEKSKVNIYCEDRGIKHSGRVGKNKLNREDKVRVLQSNTADFSIVPTSIYTDVNIPISAEALMEECRNNSNNPIFPSTLLVPRNISHHSSDAQGIVSSRETFDYTSSLKQPVSVELPFVCESNFFHTINKVTQSNTSFSSTEVCFNSGQKRNSEQLVQHSSSIKPSQKYGNLNFVKIKKASSKGDKNSEGLKLKKKKVKFSAESENSVIEVLFDPAANAEHLYLIKFSDYRKKYPKGSAFMPEEQARKRDLEKLPPREYDFIKPATEQLYSDAQVLSFCKSCNFSHGYVRNWFIVGSRFSILNENVFGMNVKTRLSRVNYPPLHFKTVCDTLTKISTDISGMKIFLAIGEDWIVEMSITTGEFICFIKNFANVLFQLYAKNYLLMKAKSDFVSDVDDLMKSYAYVEMPTLILFTIPARSGQELDSNCNAYNTALKQLIKSWDVTPTSPFHHTATKQCIELRLIDWQQICCDNNAVNDEDMITILMKHLMEDWGVCLVPKNRVLHL